MNDKSYRKNVGLIVLDKKNQLLICRRKSKKTWQFPQGGIDAGESNIKAAYRELYEEVGIKKNQVKVIKESKYWYHYDLPVKYQPWPKSLKNINGQPTGTL
jgi:putative (di)nucleoside polyphosphate hydrolase